MSSTARRSGAPAFRNATTRKSSSAIPSSSGSLARPREEVMRAAVMPDAGQPGGLQHPGNRAVTDPGDRSDDQHAERLKRRLRERRRKEGQQTAKRTGNLTHGGDPPVRATTRRSQRPRPSGLDRPPDSGSPPLSPAQPPKPGLPAPPTPAITRPPSRPPKNPETRVVRPGVIERVAIDCWLPSPPLLRAVRCWYPTP